MPKAIAKILMFEDDPGTIEVLTLFSELVGKKRGWEITVSARESILQVLKQADFDLLVVDSMIRPGSRLGAGGNIVANVHFEGINYKETGIELIRRVRQGYFREGQSGVSPTVPIILLSAISNIAEASIKNLEIVYCEKPFTVENLINLISKCLEGGTNGKRK
jgi:CheY-like chemotaxis protein